jgi:uncharacterized protein (TIGR02145 family)
VKTINFSSKRITQLWYKAWIAYLTCLLFLILPSCQKNEPNQDPMLNMDNMSSSTSSKKDNISYGKVKDIEGNVYKTVKIGKQWWMAENLKTTMYSNGDLIGTTVDPISNIESEYAPKYQWAWGGYESNVAIYGRLYTWYAITDSREVCPHGWHVPTDLEWHTLILYLDPNAKLLLYPENETYTAGDKLKESGNTHWITANEGATNESGFTALPGGFRTHTGPFDWLGTTGFWWSAPEQRYRSLNCDGGNVGRDNFYPHCGISVRCLKD